MACATEPAPRPATLDPSNPVAAESATVTLTPLSEPAPAAEERSDAEPEATLYTCPMHPEVISDKPRPQGRPRLHDNG